jgi:hypothetical protein
MADRGSFPSASPLPLDRLHMNQPVSIHQLQGIAAAVLVSLFILTGCSDSPTAPPVASLEIVAPETQVRVNETLQLSVVIRSEDGEELVGRAVEWSSSDESRATISPEGVVGGIAVGQVTITASANGATDQLSINVIETPVIESVSPGVLRPGEEMTITGLRFAPDPSNNQVWIHGVEGTVLEASETSLRVRMPDFLCRPEGLAPVTVIANLGTSSSQYHPFEPGPGTGVDVGELQLVQHPDHLCLLLDANSNGAEYLLGVQSTSQTAATRTPVRIRGFQGQTLASLQSSIRTSAAASTGEAASFQDVTRSRTARSTPASPRGQVTRDRERRLAQILPPGSPTGAETRWALHRLAERELREAEARAMAPALAGRGSPGIARTRADRPATVPASSQPGDTVQLNVPDISTDNVCQNGREMTGVIRRVGDQSIWVEDVENPSGGFTSSDFETLSLEFDNRIHDEVTAHFGEPTDLDGNDRIVIVVTRKVNEMSANTLGFVVAADFADLLDVQCPGANGGEFYYARAPDPDGTIQDPDGDTREYSRQDARSDAPVLLAHETTHIIQFGRRFQLPDFDGGQESWLLEGQATLAEEVVGHRYTGNSTRSNLGGALAFGSHPPTNTSWYVNPFVDLAVYYGLGIDSDDNFFRVSGAPESCGWLSVQSPEPCISGRIAYGVTWSLLRWLSDHFHHRFPDGDRAFQRAIIESPRAGFDVFHDVLGEDYRELLPYWAASLYTDGRLQGGDPLLEFPSWDLRNIQSGLVPEAHLVADERDFESFDQEVTVAAGSTTFHLIGSSADQPPFAFSATSTAGSGLPAHMQLWIVRLR